jgi:hypothetical protein
MRKMKVRKIWIPVFLLAALMAGCGDSDTTAGQPGNPLTPPTVASVTPSGTAPVCPNASVISATFSKAMNPATLTPSTFTLTAGGASVPGTISYAAATNTATFTLTPPATLAPSTTYTATITTGAQDTFGNPLANPFTWTFTTSATCAAPTVTTVTPTNGSTVACPNTAIITATFSHPMNPATLNSPATTFTVTGPGGASVPGTVNYVVATMIATFTPTTALAVSTPYTATVSSGAQDTFGIALAPSANNPWTFTTAPTCPPPPAVIPLGAACSFGILGGSAVTSTGNSIVNGDVGVSPGSSITGFPPGIINGVRHTTDSVAAAAQAALTTAYNTAAGLPQGTSLPPDIGGLPRVFPPGVYTTVAQPSLGITGDLTLDPVGDPNAVWIFQISSTLTTASGKVIVLSPGKPGNVFWAIGSAATLGTGTTMVGNLMAKAAVTLNTGVTLTGRALGVSASGANPGTISVDTATITVPTPCQ